MKILAIESSHDDTSISLYENREVIEEITISQTEFHKKFGGTVPEYASRNHSETIIKILEKMMSKYNLNEIDHIAYTKMPGLVGSLHVGRTFAYALGFSLDKRVIGINHMHGHIFAAAFNNDIAYPAIALIVSGGHTQLWKLESPKSEDITLIGETKDDAVGEVFDKVSRKLGLGFPGGPAIDKIAKEGTNSIDFNINNDNTYNFSFSGIKTKIFNYINKNKQMGETLDLPSICNSFQEAILKPLIIKTKRAIDEFNPSSLILGGGVSANSRLRELVSNMHENALIPEIKYTTDNASMIAITSDLQYNY